ncbi:MAG: histidine phosphatase family protein [Gammaproteobacteria bacterium]|nr:histidine phosphatase family protein [Gammaproteobacteria bacterium]MDE2345395.1 histidine phosphatase family protein [Gammaproteobacteria bacterium]
MRQVLLVRHAEAEEQANALLAGRGDAQRRLTKSGARQMQKAVAGLATQVDDIQVILSSTLVRAVQTADIVSSIFPHAKRLQHARLAPGFDPDSLRTWVSRQGGTIALVGHEPDLSLWIGYMTCGTPRSLVHMKKGSVCRLEMPDHPQPGEARIIWCLTLKQLAGLVA